MLKQKSQLLEEFPYRIELHAHSKPVSLCSNVTTDEIAEVYSNNNVDAICLTNHFYSNNQLFDGLSKEQAIDVYLNDFENLSAAAEKKGIKAYLGCEIRFDECVNDYLIYGVDRSVLEKGFDYFSKGLKAFRTEVKLEKSVFVQAHPFRDGMVKVDTDLLDGVEAFNFHPFHNSRVAVATQYAKQCGFDILTAGSDFHEDIPFHSAAVLLRTRVLPNDSFELAKILKTGDYIYELGQSCIMIP